MGVIGDDVTFCRHVGEHGGRFRVGKSFWSMLAPILERHQEDATHVAMDEFGQWVDLGKSRALAWARARLSGSTDQV